MNKLDMLETSEKKIILSKNLSQISLQMGDFFLNLQSLINRPKLWITDFYSNKNLIISYFSNMNPVHWTPFS